MSVTVTPMIASPTVQTAPTFPSTMAKKAAPLFGDLAENTPTPIPSLAGC